MFCGYPTNLPIEPGFFRSFGWQCFAGVVLVINFAMAIVRCFCTKTWDKGGESFIRCLSCGRYGNLSHRRRNGYEVLVDADSVKIQQHREQMEKLLKTVQSDVEKLSTTYEALFDDGLEEQPTFSDDELKVFVSHGQVKQQNADPSGEELRVDSSLDKKKVD